MSCQETSIENVVLAKLAEYPEHVRCVLLDIRTLVLDIISSQSLGEFEETLKWGEPSYSVKSGSAVRFDWKAKDPESYYLFFNCKTKLVDTFRELYWDVLTFEGNRAIVLNLNEPIPYSQIRHCILLSLTYKKIKHLPLLGA